MGENYNLPLIKESGIEGTKFGDNVVVIKPVNIYGCEIGKDVFIGPFVEIQKGVVIGNGCKVQSHTFICELVNIGSNCTIGHGVVFINDRYRNGGPANGNKDLWESTIIGKKVSIGSNATILPVKVCDNVVIGAGSVVTKNITIPGYYAGNPAKLLRKISK